MSSDADDPRPMNRRTLLKAAGVSVALGASATTAAAETDTDADTDDCGWEYQCHPWECQEGGGDWLERRYCCNGSCSGWEYYGCCA